MSSIFFFFNDTATTEIYTLSLHDALPIWPNCCRSPAYCTVHASTCSNAADSCTARASAYRARSSWACRSVSRAPAADRKEHTSELQSRQYLVCRLLLEKKKKNQIGHVYLT